MPCFNDDTIIVQLTLSSKDPSQYQNSRRQSHQAPNSWNEIKWVTTQAKIDRKSLQNRTVIAFIRFPPILKGYSTIFNDEQAFLIPNHWLQKELICSNNCVVYDIKMLIKSICIPKYSLPKHRQQ